MYGSCLCLALSANNFFFFLTDRVFTFTEKVLDTKGNGKMASETILLFVKLQNTKQLQGAVLICKEFLE